MVAPHPGRLQLEHLRAPRHAVGLISTCYQVGNVVSWLLAGFLCDSLGWRAAFMVPGLILVPMAVIFALGLRNRPEDAGFPP
jgi:sugar phosphate permease